MNLLDKTRFVERPQFFDGQTLFADDMQTVEAFNREMRWLHNRLLHQTGAIGNGYAVQGNKGDRAVVIGPGLALDHEGREIVLLEELNEPVPPISGDEEGGPAYFDLTVSYPHDDQLEATETRIGFCDTAGAVRLREKPIVTWVRLKKTAAGSMEVKDGEQRAAVKRGELVVVARASVLDCQLNDVLSLKQRRSARPSCRPYIGFGVEQDIKWRPWFREDEEEILENIAGSLSSDTSLIPQFNSSLRVIRINNYTLIGFRAEVNTESASFFSTPHYSARIDGNRFKQVAYYYYEEVEYIETYFVDARLYLLNPSPINFEVQIKIESDSFDSIWSNNLRNYQATINDHYEAFIAKFEENPDLDLEAKKALLKNYLNVLGELMAPVLLPDNWQISWMGVEG